jgi:hypothetical protein
MSIRPWSNIRELCNRPTEETTMRDAFRGRCRWIAVALTLLVTLPAVAPTAAVRAWQATPEPATELAAPPVLERAWRFLGQSAATDDQVTVAGWITGISGLDPAQLVAPDAAPEQRGRFTFVAELAVTRTSSRGSAVTRLGAGTLTVYLNEETVPIEEDLSSFGAGTVVAAYDVELQATALRQTPELGTIAGQMELVQTDALNFTLDGERFRFGHAGAELGLRYSGGLAPAADGATEASIFGAASVVRRDADPQGTGDAVPAVALSACDQLALWVDSTRSRLQTANELRTGIVSGDPAAADLETALATIFGLVEEQIADVGPEGSEEAASLALIALSTDRRGIEVLSTAVAAGNEAAITQGVAILADAEGLASRALSTLDTIAPTCEPSS